MYVINSSMRARMLPINCWSHVYLSMDSGDVHPVCSVVCGFQIKFPKGGWFSFRISSSFICLFAYSLVKLLYYCKRWDHYQLNMCKVWRLTRWLVTFGKYSHQILRSLSWIWDKILRNFKKTNSTGDEPKYWLQWLNSS